MKNVKKISAFLLAVLMVSALILPCYASGGNVNRYNVVMVTDCSGSMADTDPEKYRFEAIDLFMGLISDGGNFVGSVSFGTGVVSTVPISEMTDKSIKTALTDDIKAQPEEGDTDIGGALEAAVDMLDKSAKPELPSIIILLTDGFTDMTDPKQTALSIEKKETAMERAREKGCSIYTICLNSNNGAHPQELKQIADATGGEFREVNDAKGLKEIFDLYYQMIFSTKSYKLTEGNVPSDGYLEQDFTAADVGAEEVNLIVFGDIKNIELKNPQGKKLNPSEVAENSFSSKSFRIIKLKNPESGTWSCRIGSEPGSELEIYKIYNSDLNVSCAPAESSGYNKGSEILINTEVFEGSEKVTEAEKLATLQAKITVTKKSKQTGRAEIIETIDAVPADGMFTCGFTPKDYGTYRISAEVTNGEITAKSEEFSVDVGNTPPVVSQEVIKKHINRWPFLIKTDSTVDFSSAVSDKEDSELTYKVLLSSWNPEDYTVQGTELTIDNFSVSKGSFRIEAIDEQGASAAFDVKITSTNIGLLAMILMLIGIIIGVGIIIAVILILRGKAFMGEITVENLESGESYNIHPGRGNVKLINCPVGNTGFDKKARFQATNKDYIFFIASAPFTSDASYGELKKIKIITGQDTRIFSDAEQTKGITVRFDSDINSSADYI